MTQMGEQAGRGDVGGALAETAGTFGAGELARGVRGAQNAVRGSIYTPEGVLKPGIETASKVAGGAVGAGAGAVAGHGGGAIAGAYGGGQTRAKRYQDFVSQAAGCTRLSWRVSAVGGRFLCSARRRS
jgi:hypothetical protein